MGYLGMVAMVGFYDALRHAGPVMILAPILGVIGLTLVTVSHLIPIAMAYELVPAYTDADPAGRATLAATADTLSATALVTNSAGNFLGRGIATPMSSPGGWVCSRRPPMPSRRSPASGSSASSSSSSARVSPCSVGTPRPKRRP